MAEARAPRIDRARTSSWPYDAHRAPSHGGTAMEVIIALAVIALLALFLILSIRYGADSRKVDPRHPNWP